MNAVSLPIRLISGEEYDRRRRLRNRLRNAVKANRRAGKFDLANAAQELLTAYMRAYPLPSYRGLGDAGEVS